MFSIFPKNYGNVTQKEDDFTNAIYPRHFERREKFRAGSKFAGNDFRFLTPFGMTTLRICGIVSLKKANPSDRAKLLRRLM